MSVKPNKATESRCFDCVTLVTLIRTLAVTISPASSGESCELNSLSHCNCESVCVCVCVCDSVTVCDHCSHYLVSIPSLKQSKKWQSFILTSCHSGSLLFFPWFPSKAVRLCFHNTSEVSVSFVADSR